MKIKKVFISLREVWQRNCIVKLEKKMNEAMNDVLKDFYEFLGYELAYLKNVNNFLKNIPDMIVKNKLKDFEFGNFIEKYEIEVYKIAIKKKDFLVDISKYYGIDASEISFSYLDRVSEFGFLNLRREIIQVSNMIGDSLLKVSIYVNRFSILNRDLKKVNGLLYQNNYASDGEGIKERKKSIFYSEA